MLDVIARLLLSAGILYGTTELPTSSRADVVRTADAAAPTATILVSVARLG